jgi:EpsI family protein
MSEREDKAQMKARGFTVDRRSLVIGAGLTAAGAFAHLRSPVAAGQPLEPTSFSAAIPATVAGWTSRKSAEVVLPPQDESNKLYENLETRIYEGPNLPAMMLLIAFSSIQQNDIQVHRPEVCYPASGYPILWSKPIEIGFRSTNVMARELLADRGGLRERIVYWVRVGNAFPTNWAEQRTTMALQNLQGSIPDGALFRVSSIEEPDSSNSAALTQFIEMFLSTVPPSFRQSVLL